MTNTQYYSAFTTGVLTWEGVFALLASNFWQAGALLLASLLGCLLANSEWAKHAS